MVQNVSCFALHVPQFPAIALGGEGGQLIKDMLFYFTRRAQPTDKRAIPSEATIANCVVQHLPQFLSRWRGGGWHGGQGKTFSGRTEIRTLSIASVVIQNRNRLSSLHSPKPASFSRTRTSTSSPCLTSLSLSSSLIVVRPLSDSLSRVLACNSADGSALCRALRPFPIALSSVGSVGRQTAGHQLLTPNGPAPISTNLKLLPCGAAAGAW